MTVNIGDMIRNVVSHNYYVIVEVDIYPQQVTRLKLFDIRNNRFDYLTSPFGCRISSNFEVV